MKLEVPLPQLRAFEDSGWVFLPRNEARNLSGDVQEAKIFVKPGGRLALSTNKLVVKLHGDPDESEANEILEPFGCRVLEKLSFAPGLFRVEVNKPEQVDAVEIANQLVASGVCEFAEPELIEALSER
ncbi:MAG TPA: hypothetical protein VK582_24355 [Pyrinomonadaceae bacterium]|nr:hypothetical protein [Pyrinomonadaceae bacterium]